MYFVRIWEEIDCIIDTTLYVLLVSAINKGTVTLLMCHFGHFYHNVFHSVELLLYGYTQYLKS